MLPCLILSISCQATFARHTAPLNSPLLVAIRVVDEVGNGETGYVALIDWMAECGDVCRRLSSDSESGNHQRPGGQTTATACLVPSRRIKNAGCEN